MFTLTFRFVIYFQEERRLQEKQETVKKGRFLMWCLVHLLGLHWPHRNITHDYLLVCSEKSVEKKTPKEEKEKGTVHCILNLVAMRWMMPNYAE